MKSALMNVKSFMETVMVKNSSQCGLPTVFLGVWNLIWTLNPKVLFLYEQGW